MIKLLLPFLFLLVGTGAGIGAGLFFRPAEPDLPAMEMADPCGTRPEGGTETAAGGTGQSDDAASAGEMDYARLNNQFVVPVISENAVSSLVVVSLSVEVPRGRENLVFEREPKLRDAFLQVLFEHANIGGFDGHFTSTSNMRTLRNSLRGAARGAIGPEASDVLILEMVRQDV